MPPLWSEDPPGGDGLFARLDPESEVYSLDLFGSSQLTTTLEDLEILVI